MKILWLDLETTGLDPEKNRIIELAAIYKDGMMKASTFHCYVKHDEYPENFSEIEKLTGITRADLEEKGMPEDSAFSDFLAFIAQWVDQYNKADKMIFAGYNARFDNDFMRALFSRQGNNFFGSYFFAPVLDVYSTVAEALLIGDLETQENYKLATVAGALGIQHKAHSAIEDIKVTREIYKKLRFEKWMKKPKSQ